MATPSRCIVHLLATPALGNVHHQIMVNLKKTTCVKLLNILKVWKRIEEFCYCQFAVGSQASAQLTGRLMITCQWWAGQQLCCYATSQHIYQLSEHQRLCGAEPECKQVVRILYRSSDVVKLTFWNTEYFVHTSLWDCLNNDVTSFITVRMYFHPTLPQHTLLTHPRIHTGVAAHRQVVHEESYCLKDL